MRAARLSVVMNLEQTHNQVFAVGGTAGGTMTVVFRTIWQDESSSVVDSTCSVFMEWLKNRKHTQSLEFRDSGTTDHGKHHSVVNKAEDAILARYQNGDGATGATWVTTLRAWQEGAASHYWVDLEVLLEDQYCLSAPAPPNLIRMLIEGGKNPTTYEHPLRTEPWEIQKGALSTFPDFLASARRLPLLVVSEPPEAVNYFWRQRAFDAANRLIGFCDVATIDESASSTLKEMARGLAVWGGAARLYYPSVDLSGTDCYRHKVWPRGLFKDNERRLTNLVARRISYRSGRKAPPQDWEVWQDRLEFELPEIVTDHDACNRELRSRQLQLDEAKEWLAEAVRHQEHWKSSYNELMRAARERGVLDELFTATPPEPEADDDNLGLCDIEKLSDAVEWARMLYGKELSIPEGVLHGNRELSASISGNRWAYRTWQGLKALAYYARSATNEDFNGGFYAWCLAGSPHVWPASSKKLAMNESESVRNSHRLMEYRIFPVVPELNKECHCTMTAHLKISEGGGSNIPRVYFFDDTKGVTGKVHIGFIGPHRLVPNTLA